MGYLGTMIASGLGSYAQGKALRESQEAWREDRAYQKRQRDRLEQQQKAEDEFKKSMGEGYEMVSDPATFEAFRAEEAKRAAGYRPQWRGLGATPAQAAPAQAAPAQAAPGLQLPAHPSDPDLTPSNIPPTEGVYNSAPGAYTSPVVAQTAPLPARPGVSVEAIGAPAASVAGLGVQPQPQASPQPPQQPQQIDRAAILKPKMEPDALFYQSVWLPRRAEYMKVHGMEKTMAMDANLRKAANQGYVRRLGEAAVLEHAGDKAGAVQKWMELYNRDLPDNRVASAKLNADGTVDVVQFDLQGQEVARFNQPYPALKAAFMAYAGTPEQQLEYMNKQSDYTILVAPDGSGAVAVPKHNPGGPQIKIPGAVPAATTNITLGTEARAKLQEDDQAFRAAENAKDRAARAAQSGDTGKLTDKQKRDIQVEDARINDARTRLKGYKADEKNFISPDGKKIPRNSPRGKELSKLTETARMPHSSEIKP